MPIQLKYSETQQSYIYLTLTPSYTLNNWYEAISTLCVMMNQVDYPINLILDMSTLNQLPLDIIEALNCSTARYHKNHYAQVAIVKSALCVPMQTLLDNVNMTQGTAVASSYEQAISMCESLKLTAIA